MFKILIFLFAFSTSAYAEEKFICAVTQAYRLKPVFDAMNGTDKFKHCAVSCMIGLQCSSIEVLGLGIAKEIYDILTPGDADLRDIKADIIGILHSIKPSTQTDQDCLDYCQNRYP